MPKKNKKTEVTQCVQTEARNSGFIDWRSVYKFPFKNY